MLFWHLSLTVWSLGQTAVIQSYSGRWRIYTVAARIIYDLEETSNEAERRIPKDSQIEDFGIHLQGQTL